MILFDYLFTYLFWYCGLQLVGFYAQHISTPYPPHCPSVLPSPSSLSPFICCDNLLIEDYLSFCCCWVFNNDFTCFQTSHC